MAKSYLIYLVLCIALLSSQRSLSETFRYKSYYIPLDVDFYQPVPRKNMPNQSATLRLNSTAIEEVFRFIDAEQKSFSARESLGLLRVVVIDEATQREFCISQDKKIIFNGFDINYPKSKVQTIVTELMQICKKDRPNTKPGYLFGCGTSKK